MFVYLFIHYYIIYQDWKFLQAYSPYHNISPNGPKSVLYPPLLMTTSTRDDRVHPYHARCFVNRLLDRQKTSSSGDNNDHDLNSKGTQMTKY